MLQAKYSYFYNIVPCPSFSSMSFSLIYIWGHSICCFPHCSHMFLTCREPGVPLSLFRSYLLPFPCALVCIMFLSLPFLLCLYSLIYTCCSSRAAFYLLFFPHYNHIFCRIMDNEESPVSSPLPFSPPFLLY